MAYKQVSPIPVVEGGTGATTFGDGHVLLGSGTSPLGSLDVTAKGSILVGDGTTAPIALPVGSDGEVLSANSSTPSGLEWGLNSASGAWNFISSATASSSATVEFTDLDSTHFMYMVVIDSVHPATDGAVLYFRTSVNNGVSFDSAVNDYFGSVATQEIIINLVLGNQPNENLSGNLLIYNPSSINWTRVTFEASSNNQAGAFNYASGGGVRRTTTPVDAIQFLMSTGNISSGIFNLYGLLAS